MKRGDLVDEFELPDQTGKDRKFSDFLAYGPVVVFFYPAAGTPGCIDRVGEIRAQAAADEEKAPRGWARAGSFANH